MRKVLSFAFISTLVCVQAFAQLDPLLIAPSTSTKTNPEDVDSRYTIKNKPSPAPTVTSTPEPQAPVVVLPVPEAPKKPPAPKFIKAQQEKVAETKVLEPHEYDMYADIPYDISKNILEVKTESFVVYNDSKSNYKYRDYNTFSQGIGLGVDVWIDKTVGVETVYKTTVNSHTQGLDQTIQLKQTERWFDFAAQLRSEIDSSRSPYYVTKLGFSNYQKKMPVDNTDRSTLDTLGPKLEFEVYFPTSNTHIWNVNFDIKPFQTHKEKAVGLNLGAGDKAKSWIWGAGVGGRTIFNRKYQFFWNMNYSLEKIIFSGDSKQVDPLLGVTLTNVPINNSFLFFNFGFIWGG